MLRKLSFRTKLLCTLAVPMVAHLAITAIVGRERLDKANAADSLGQSITLVASTLDLDHAVQRELAASANPAATDELASARAATDAAAAALLPALGSGTGSTLYDHATSRTRSDIKSLASARANVDKGGGISSYSLIYTELTSALADLTTAIGDNAADPALARQTAALAALARVADATAIESAVVESGATHGTFAPGEAGLLQGAVADRTQWEAVYDGLATSAASSALRATMIGDAINTSNAIETSALNAPDGVALGIDANAWRTAMASRLDLLHGAETTGLSGISAAAAHVVSDARADLRNFWIIAMASVLISMALGLLLTRSITRPLRKLTTAARLLADEQLPALVEGLKNPGADDQRFLKSAVEPIDVRSDDELGQLAQAFNAVQAVAVDVAAEQAELLRKGIGDIFVSLARRNQVLIDRQIEFLDELEAAEDDPDQLSSLYRLDHLATRMRRNARVAARARGHRADPPPGQAGGADRRRARSRSARPRTTHGSSSSASRRSACPAPAPSTSGTCSLSSWRTPPTSPPRTPRSPSRVDSPATATSWRSSTRGSACRSSSWLSPTACSARRRRSAWPWVARSASPSSPAWPPATASRCG